MLIRGRNLTGARISADHGLKVSNAQVSDSGTSILLDVELSRSVRSGAHQLTITTRDGEAEAPFGVMDALPQVGQGAGFGPDDVVYLVLPDRFSNGDSRNDNQVKSPRLNDRAKPRFYHGGDLRGLIDRLPYLADLGVTALWLTPWYDNHDRLDEPENGAKGEPFTDYHGYGPVDFYSVDEHFGDLTTLRELVFRAHARGIRIIQDMVANHTGPHHPWVADPPTPTWYHRLSDGGHLANSWQTWTIADPYGTDAGRRATLEGWFANLLPDLNQNDPEVARYLIQNALWWVGVTGLDGIRADTVPYVPRAFWQDWSTALKRQHPRVTLLGEVSEVDTATASFFQGGQARFDGVDTGIEALFDYPLYARVREVFAEGKSFQPLAGQLGRDHLWVNPDQLLTFLGLHDTDRFMNAPGATTEGLRLAFTFLFTTRGFPLVYYGDELALRGGGDPDNRRDFPGGWPTDPRSAFTATGRTDEENAVWNHVQKLARLRKDSEALRRGRLVQLHVTDREYAYQRIGANEDAIIVMNNDRAPRTIRVPLAGEPASWRDALGSGCEGVLGGGEFRVEMPGRSAAVFRRPYAR